MLNAIAYCRVSTDEQAADGRHSLPAQRRLCAEKAAELGYALAATFEDPGRSGRSMSRPALRDLLLRCQEDGSIRAVFVQDTDRLARNTQDHLTIRAMLAKRGIKLISVSQPMLEESAEGNMIDTILASVNQFQSELTARKVLKGMEQKVRSGWWPSRAPLGYRNIWQDPAGEKRTIEPDPETGPLIQEAFRLYATGRFALSQLCRHLHEHGLRPRRGPRLATNRLHDILINPFYYGWLRWHGIELQGQHTPLITKGLFEAVQGVLKQHNRGGSREWKHRFLLRGFLRCDRCGRRLVGEYHLRKRRGYYRCHEPGGCSPGIEFAEAQRQVAVRVRGITFSSGFAEALVEALRQRHEAERKTVESKRHGLVNRRTGFEARLKLAEDKLLAGVFTDAIFLRHRADIEGQILAVDEQLAGLHAMQRGAGNFLAEILGFVRDLPGAYERAPEELKRLYLGFFWQEFTVAEGRIIDARPSTFYAALQASSVSTNSEREGLVRTQPTPEKTCSRDLVRTSTLWWTKRIDVRPLMSLVEDTKTYNQLRAQWETIRSARQAADLIPSGEMSGEARRLSAPRRPSITSAGAHTAA